MSLQVGVGLSGVAQGLLIMSHITRVKSTQLYYKVPTQKTAIAIRNVKTVSIL